MYNLKNDQSFVIKEVDIRDLQWLYEIKRITLWRQKNNFVVKKPMKKFQVFLLFLIKTIHNTLQKIRKRVEISSNILDYFNAENPKFGRFYLLPKIHKRCMISQKEQ